MKSVFRWFWQWYERHIFLNTLLAAALFLLQIVHLVWLTLAVVVPRLANIPPLWPDAPLLNLLLTLVDYTEIPALVTTSLFYLHAIRNGAAVGKPLAYLLLLNSQWLHIFWITDEFVVVALTGHGAGTVLPAWLAWIAILIDYAEVPVMIDLVHRVAKAWRTGGLQAAGSILREHD